MTARFVRCAPLILLPIVLLLACNADPVDKSGAAPDRPTTLRMLMPETGDPDGNFFIEAVARRSHGRLRVVIDSVGYESSDPALEARAAGALRAGKADLGLLAARNWAAAGDGGFQAVLAPFTITTLAATIALSDSVVARALVGGLHPMGVVGLGLIPGEPRQILSTRPLFGATLGHARIRIVDNPQTAALITALSGVPVEGVKAGPAHDGLRSGSLVGAETSPIYALANAYNIVAPYLTAYALMPKLNTIVATDRSWQRLDQVSRAAIRQAVADTRRDAADHLPGRERKELAALCASGVVIDQLPGTDLLAMATAAQSVAPASRQAQRMRRLINSSLHGLGPQPIAVTPPAACPMASTAAQATKLTLRRSDHQARRQHGGATIPPGTYVTTVTVADFRANGVTGHDWDKDITFTQTFRPDGSFLCTQVPDYPDQGPVTGRYEVTGDTVRFTFDPATNLAPETVKWSYLDGQLTFSIVQVQDDASVVLYLAHPWRRVR